MVANAAKRLTAAGLFHDSLDRITSIGTEGYFVMVNHVRMGPEFIQSSYPQDWQAEYDQNAYHLRDPILLWSLAQDGARRWSEVTIPDAFGVMKRARRHGLVFGAVFSRGVSIKKSVLSVARDDRELTDKEMTVLAEWFDQYVMACNNKQPFSVKELKVLQCLANDMTVEEAATYLNISGSAAKARLKTARDRHGVKTNTRIVATALRSNLIE